MTFQVSGVRVPSVCTPAVQVIYHSIEREILHRMMYDSSEAWPVEPIVMRVTGQKYDFSGFLGRSALCLDASRASYIPFDRARNSASSGVIFKGGLSFWANRHKYYFE